jgi:hypothetical protein
MMNIKNQIFHNLLNAVGWHTNRKFLIIESDDWGSLRMPSKEAFYKLKKLNLGVEDDLFNRFDSLENSVDLTKLMEILDKHRDKNGNPLCITANTIMSNPDFEKINESGFQSYHRVGLDESYKRYSDGSLAVAAISEAIKQKFFSPQFHGREHLNVPLWIEALRSGDTTTLSAFREHVFSLRTNFKIGIKQNYMASFEACVTNDNTKIKESLREGLQLFEEYFQVKSKTIIAPCYIWNEVVEEVSADAGVSGIQGIPYQYLSTTKGVRRKLHYTGQVNKYGQIYLVRNAFFEPTLEGRKEVVGDCLNRIGIAFQWKKPAIIGSHRVNYMGSLVESNRDKNLKLLDSLLIQVKKQWPDVEFISSDQLVGFMKDGNNLYLR